MIFLLLLLLGIVGVIIDLKKGRRGVLALFWNNFRYYLIVGGIYWYIIGFTLDIYNLSKLTNVFAKFSTYNIQWIAMGFYPIVLVIFGFILIFIDIPYKKRKRLGLK